MVFKVKWKDLAKHMTKHLFIILSVGFIAIILVRFVSTSFDVGKTFEHIPFYQLPLFFLGIFAFSTFFGVGLGYLLKCTSVKIDDGIISGRDYWLIKRRFKMEEIEKAFPFNSNGMPVVVVDAGKKGQIYVPVHIENSEHIFGILDKYA